MKCKSKKEIWDEYYYIQLRDKFDILKAYYQFKRIGYFIFSDQEKLNTFIEKTIENEEKRSRIINVKNK